MKRKTNLRFRFNEYENIFFDAGNTRISKKIMCIKYTLTKLSLSKTTHDVKNLALKFEDKLNILLYNYCI